jgi:hypothetical protein
MLVLAISYLGTGHSLISSRQLGSDDGPSAKKTGSLGRVQNNANSIFYIQNGDIICGQNVHVTKRMGH